MPTQSRSPYYVPPEQAPDIRDFRPQQPEEVQPAPAGFWRRFGAYFIDGLILFIPTRLLGHFMPTTVLAAVVPTLITAAYFIVFWAMLGATPGYQALAMRVVRLDERPVRWGIAAVRYALLAFFSVLLYTGVVLITAGALVAEARATVPFVVFGALCSLLGLLNFLWVFWDRDKQAWHDKIARTVVVYHPELRDNWSNSASGRIR